jgi:hypothetical protein
MRLFPISPHFRPALSLLHRTPASHKFRCALPHAHRALLPRPYCHQPYTPTTDDDMGKEDKSSKNFSLKVPKGTRDCKLRLLLAHACALRHRACH